MAAVQQSEEKHLLKLVEEAFGSLGVRVSTGRLPNQEEFWFRNYHVPVGATVTFYRRNKNNASIELGVIGSCNVSIRIEKGVASIVRRNVGANRFI